MHSGSQGQPHRIRGKNAELCKGSYDMIGTKALSDRHYSIVMTNRMDKMRVLAPTEI